MDVLQSESWIRLAIICGMILACSTVLAYLQPAISQVLSRLFAVTFAPMHAVQRESFVFIRKCLAWSGRQVRDEEGGNTWQRVLGTTLGAVFFALCIYSDLGIVMMTLEAYGFGSLQLALLSEPIWAIGAALVSSGAVWGILLSDLLGATRFWPWTEKFRGKLRRVTVYFAGAMILLMVAVIACMAAWRSGSLAEAMDSNQNLSVQATDGGHLSLGADAAQSQPEALKGEIQLKSIVKEKSSDSWMIYFPNVGIAVSSFLGTAVSVNSFLPFLKYAGLALVVLGCIVVGIPVALLWVLLMLNDAIYWLFEAILNLLTMPGRALLGLMGVGRSPQQQAQAVQTAQGNPVTPVSADQRTNQADNQTEESRADSGASENDEAKKGQIENGTKQTQAQDTTLKNLPADKGEMQRSDADSQETEPEPHRPQAVNYDPFRA